MQKMVTEYINNCELCQVAKYDRHPPKIKFSLTPTPKQPLEVLHMDTFQFSNTKFLTVIDSFSKYAQAYHLDPVCTAATVYENILIFVNHHGIPQSVTTDNGREFNNSLFTEFCKLHKIQLHFTTPCNSNSNSPIERLHSTLLELLRILKIKFPKLCPKELMQNAILAYNTSIHSVTKQRPFDLINGRLDVLDPFDLSDEIIVSQFIDDRRERLKFIYNNIHQATDAHKKNIIEKRNKTREDPSKFPQGSKAYVKDKTASGSKLKPRFTKTEVKKDLGTKVWTINKRKGLVHKSQIQKPKAFSSFPQDHESGNQEGSYSHSIPSTSRDNQSQQ
ncbi:unnamed protein product [Acanthoscelides obtectus]|uniref:Integrase catalytic domain-containing protein n=1 Tax=Acanthoscelides obtectus TaxID=200917 RepID=A0A9P0K8E1_ACAOB|nr:unnamed protein product [Acanthoscelides obtectus]CAK1666630.1 Retrovirus-related Pol polyprotein from transposon opus [Acanthoscelides obtectus]